MTGEQIGRKRRGGEKGEKESGCVRKRERGERGQVLAVQELLCLHDQAAKMFSSSKSAVKELTLRNGLRRLWPLAAQRRITAAPCRIRLNTYTHAGLNGNYRGPQTCGQPLRDAVSLG